MHQSTYQDLWCRWWWCWVRGVERLGNPIWEMEVKIKIHDALLLDHARICRISDPVLKDWRPFERKNGEDAVSHVAKTWSSRFLCVVSVQWIKISSRFGNKLQECKAGQLVYAYLPPSQQIAMSVRSGSCKALTAVSVAPPTSWMYSASPSKRGQSYKLVRCTRNIS